MTALSKIEGICAAYAEKLQAAGVGSIEALLQKGASAKGRQALAGTTAISNALILKWVNRSDLFRVKGLGEQYTDLLKKAGWIASLNWRSANPRTRSRNSPK